MRQTGVGLRYMMEFGARPTDRNLLLSAQFLHKELPIRIARRALDLESLPFGLSKKPAVLKVNSIPNYRYCHLFRDLGRRFTSGSISCAFGFSVRMENSGYSASPFRTSLIRDFLQTNCTPLVLSRGMLSFQVYLLGCLFWEHNCSSRTQCTS
jgi:hypothetical protein